MSVVIASSPFYCRFGSFAVAGFDEAIVLILLLTVLSLSWRLAKHFFRHDQRRQAICERIYARSRLGVCT